MPRRGRMCPPRMRRRKPRAAAEAERGAEEAASGRRSRPMQRHGRQLRRVERAAVSVADAPATQKQREPTRTRAARRGPRSRRSARAREAARASCTICSAGSSRSPARPDLTLKAADRALRDVRTALGAMPPLPTKQDFEDVARRLKAAQDGARRPRSRSCGKPTTGSAGPTPAFRSSSARRWRR